MADIKDGAALPKEPAPVATAPLPKPKVAAEGNVFAMMGKSSPVACFPKQLLHTRSSGITQAS
jgi:hypothetical protein